MRNFSRRHLLKTVAAGAAYRSFLAPAPPLEAAPPPPAIPKDFVDLKRSYVTEEALYLHVGEDPGSLIEAKDGSLIAVSQEGRAISPDGGKTWGPRTAMHGTDGQAISGRGSFHTALRLKPGDIGGFSNGSGPTTGPYSLKE